MLTFCSIENVNISCIITSCYNQILFITDHLLILHRDILRQVHLAFLIINYFVIMTCSIEDLWQPDIPGLDM